VIDAESDAAMAGSGSPFVTNGELPAPGTPAERVPRGLDDFGTGDSEARAAGRIGQRRMLLHGGRRAALNRYLPGRPGRVGFKSDRAADILGRGQFAERNA